MSSPQMVSYNGQMVVKEPFRVFVYGTNNTKKLVESWEEFEKALHSGDWFSNPEIKEKEHKTKKNKKGTDSILERVVNDLTE